MLKSFIVYIFDAHARQFQYIKTLLNQNSVSATAAKAGEYAIQKDTGSSRDYEDELFVCHFKASNFSRAYSFLATSSSDSSSN